MARSILWLFWMVACDGEAPPTPTTEACTTDLTWTNFAGPLVITWCQPCHSAGVEGIDRQGAPPTLNFDTPAEVMAVADRVLARATGPEADMPPGGGPSDSERASLAEWLGCGLATGTTEPPALDPCVPRVEVPGDGRASEWDCAAGNVVVGDFTADASAACVCEVTGTVSVTGGARVDLPELVHVGGDLLVTGPAEAVSAPWLASVGGSVAVADNPALTELNLVRLGSIGGGLTFADNDAMLTLALLGSLETVGDVVIRGNDALRGADGLARVAEVRSLVVQDNPSLLTLRAFLFVTEMDGELVFEGNPALGAIDVTPDLTRAGAIRLRNNLSLAQLSSFAFLTELEGDLEIANLPAVRDLGNGAPRGGPWQALQHIGGSLILTDNTALASAAALHGLTAVDGDVTVTGNPKLGQAEVDALLAAIDAVGGTITASGNGP